MEYWSEIETDFMAQYGVLDPLALSWRKFLVLVRGLAPTSRFTTVIREGTSEHRKEVLRHAIHADDEDFVADKPSITRVSPEDFLKGL